MPNRPALVSSSLAVWGAIFWLAHPTRSVACEAAPCTCEQAAIQTYCQGSWSIAVSTNFQVCSLRSVAEAHAAARRCEEIRASLNKSLEFSAVATWTPKCQVILHPSLRSYVAAVGAGSEATIGSSLVRPATGTVASRRIDLRADGPNYLESAAPHEVCHLLVADRFRHRPAPLWYDEGLALLTDQPGKLKLHERDLRDGLRRRTTFRAHELFAAESYPAAERMGVFYSQCAALTQLLLSEGTPARLHEFASIVPTVGANAALRSTYGINGTAELEAKWANVGSSLPLQPMALLLPTQVAGDRFEFASVAK